MNFDGGGSSGAAIGEPIEPLSFVEYLKRACDVRRDFTCEAGGLVYGPDLVLLYDLDLLLLG